MTQTISGTALQGMDYSSFRFLTAGFTDRETQIMQREPVNNLRKREVRRIVKKAEKAGLEKVAEEMMERYDELFVNNG